MPYLADLLPFMVIFERMLWPQSGPPAYYHQTPVLDSLFNNVAGLRGSTLLNREFNTSIFLWFPKFLTTPILKNTFISRSFSLTRGCPRVYTRPSLWCRQFFYQNQNDVNTFSKEASINSIHYPSVRYEIWSLHRSSHPELF